MLHLDTRRKCRKICVDFILTNFHSKILPKINILFVNKDENALRIYRIRFIQMLRS